MQWHCQSHRRQRGSSGSSNSTQRRRPKRERQRGRGSWLGATLGEAEWTYQRCQAAMEKTAADARRRCQVAIYCEGLGVAMAGACLSRRNCPDRADLELEEQWELEEAAERCEEEAWMDEWSNQDKDDY